MTIGIVAFLEPTQNFFMEQRLVWSMIIITIGMTMTSGQSLFGFFCRVLGTVIGMVLSLLVWYIVDGKIPGVITFLWLSLFVIYYFFIKFPRMLNANIIVLVTVVLILRIRTSSCYHRTGGGLAEQPALLPVSSPNRPLPSAPGTRVLSNRPIIHRTYELAPYRLASQAGGALVGFIWTVFPSPLTDRTWLRRDVAATLYLNRQLLWRCQFRTVRGYQRLRRQCW